MHARIDKVNNSQIPAPFSSLNQQSPNITGPQNTKLIDVIIS